MKTNFLKALNIHPGWEGFLTSDIREEINKIESELRRSDFTPAPENALRFLSLPIKTAKVIIIGQDPYPQAGVATGRAFEVGNLKSWNEPFNNISLKNILRAIYKAYSGEIIKYNQLKAKFDNEFPVLPPSKLFKDWEKQGVLLLNTSFTCRVGEPGSHKKYWEGFSENLFNYINEANPAIKWFLWGNHAREAVAGLDLKNKVETMHPMMCFNKPGRHTDFLYGKVNCFELLKEQINWAGFKIKGEFKTAGQLF